MGKAKDSPETRRRTLDRLRVELARLRVDDAPLVERAFISREIERLEKGH